MNGLAASDISSTRSEVLEPLRVLNETIKGQQSLLKSCADAEWLDDEQRRAVRCLLDALIDHRRRVLMMTRLWRSLGPADVLDDSLVRETLQVIDENRYFLPHVNKYRALVTTQAGLEHRTFWLDMLELARANLSEVAGSDAPSSIDCRTSAVQKSEAVQ